MGRANVLLTVGGAMGTLAIFCTGKLTAYLNAEGDIASDAWLLGFGRFGGFGGFGGLSTLWLVNAWFGTFL